MLCAGLLTAIVKPVEAAQTNRDFAAWLQSLAKQAEATELKQQLDELKQSKKSLSELIRQASQIISQNGGEFNLPLDKAGGDLQQVLLVEWNQFKTGSAMAALPAVESAKPLLAPSHQKLLQGDALLWSPRAMGLWEQHVTPFDLPLVPSRACHLVPMVNSIAIGAP